MHRLVAIYYKDIKNNCLNRKTTSIVLLIILVLLIPINNINFPIKYMLIFPTVMSGMIVIYSVTTLASEFYTERYKVLFTTNINRSSIFIAKLLASITTGLFWGTIFNVILSISVIASGDRLDGSFYAQSMIIFLVYTLLVTSVSMLIIIVTGSYSAAFVLCFMLFVNSLSKIIVEIGYSCKNEMLNKLLINNVFYKAVQALSNQQIQKEDTIEIIIFAIMINIVSVFVLSRKDL